MRKKTRKAFDIPGINNEKCALMKHLGLNIDCDAEYGRVVEIKKVPSHRHVSSGRTVSYFGVGGDFYRVAHGADGLIGGKVQFFNSSLWSIEKIDENEA